MSKSNIYGVRSTCPRCGCNAELGRMVCDCGMLLAVSEEITTVSEANKLIREMHEQTQEMISDWIRERNEKFDKLYNVIKQKQQLIKKLERELRRTEEKATKTSKKEHTDPDAVCIDCGASAEDTALVAMLSTSKWYGEIVCRCRKCYEKRGG